MDGPQREHTYTQENIAGATGFRLLPCPTEGIKQEAGHEGIYPNSDSVFKQEQTFTSLDRSRDDDNLIFSKYTFFWISRREDERIYQVMVELPRNCTVIDAIEKILPYFNQELATKSTYKLDLTADLYDLYSAKKSGRPKSDYPALDEDQNLNQTGLQLFTLVEKDSRAIIQTDAVPIINSMDRLSDYHDTKEKTDSMLDHGMQIGSKAQISTAYASQKFRAELAETQKRGS